VIVSMPQEMGKLIMIFIPDIFPLTLNASPQCPQPPMFANSKYFQSHLDWPTDVEESEFDCLNLFIVRPSPSALGKAGFDANNVKLPVYVNIHGGGFGFGAGTDPMWGMSYFLRLGISVYAIHRLTLCRSHPSSSPRCCRGQTLHCGQHQLSARHIRLWNLL
jgi:Carboxylesterase family